MSTNCNVNDCCFSPEDSRNAAIMQQLTKEVQQLAKECKTEHLSLHEKVANTCLYIKANLSKTLRDLLTDMERSGELDNIINETVLSQLTELDYKNLDRVSVKEFGAVGDGVADDTNAMQDAINFAHLHNKVVLVPPGTYLISQGLKLYQRMHLLGTDRNTTIIKRVGNKKEKGETFSAALIFARTNDFDFDYTEGQKLQHITFECEGANYGIYSDLSCPYTDIDNVNVNQANVGIYYGAGSWLASMSNLNIWKCATGIEYHASGTSTKLENIYVMNSTKYAYNIEGLSYSNWKNVCADWCTGVVYRFSFCHINIEGMGSECTTADNVLNLNNSRVSISAANLFALVNESSVYIIGNAGHLKMVNSRMGTNAESKGKFLEAGVKFNAEFDMCDLSGIDGESSTGAAYNVTHFNTGRSGYNVSLHEKLPFIGAYNVDVDGEALTEHLGYKAPMIGIYGNVMGSPLKGYGLQNNRDWYPAKNAGDLFVNQALNDGVAIFQQITDGGYHYGEGIITAINGNVLTLSTLSLGVAKDAAGYGIAVGGRLYTHDRTKSSAITAVSGVTVTVEYATAFNVGDHFWYKGGASSMINTKFAAVQRVMADPTSKRPKNPVPGMMFLDLTLMKPIWWTGSKWIDYNGNAV